MHDFSRNGDVYICRHNPSNKSTVMKFLDYLIYKEKFIDTENDTAVCAKCSCTLHVPNVYYSNIFATSCFGCSIVVCYMGIGLATTIKGITPANSFLPLFVGFVTLLVGPWIMERIASAMIFSINDWDEFFINQSGNQTFHFATKERCSTQKRIHQSAKNLARMIITMQLLGIIACVFPAISGGVLLIREYFSTQKKRSVTLISIIALVYSAVFFLIYILFPSVCFEIVDSCLSSLIIGWLIYKTDLISWN